MMVKKTGYKLHWNCRYQTAGTRLHVRNCWYQTASTKLQVPNYTYQTSGTKLHVPNYMYQTARTKLRVPNCTYHTARTKQNTESAWSITLNASLFIVSGNDTAALTTGSCDGSCIMLAKWFLTSNYWTNFSCEFNLFLSGVKFVVEFGTNR